jgi:hypothetical protein
MSFLICTQTTFYIASGILTWPLKILIASWRAAIPTCDTKSVVPALLLDIYLYRELELLPDIPLAEEARDKQKKTAKSCSKTL